MTESLILKSKRVFFPKTKQKTFILKAKRKLGLTDAKIANLLKITQRTLTDWKREKFSISLDAVKTILKKTDMDFPENVEIRNPFWYVNIGGRSGGLAVYNKYGIVGGNPEKRKRKWREWWEKKGKFLNHPILQCKSINKPKKNRDLAEFVGIVLGDGGITKRQITITLHQKDDKEYIKYIIELIKKLFKVNASLYDKKNCAAKNVIISRTKLVNFFVEELGLKIGNKTKQQIDIPNWIKRKQQFQIACVRGLVDTDGSVFSHKYKVNRKSYIYKKMTFTNHSKPLLLFVYNALKNLGLNPRLAKEKNDIWLDNQKDIRKYFLIIKPHNPKHIKRYSNGEVA